MKYKNKVKKHRKTKVASKNVAYLIKMRYICKKENIMCKISIDTVRRANKKTIMEIGKKAYMGNTDSKSSLDVSVSVMGKVYGQRISTNQIKSSFTKAVSCHA